MRSAGWALGWDIWSRYRILFSLALVYLLALVVLVQVVPAATMSHALLGLSMAPLFVLAYLLAAFTYGEQGAIESADSLFPRRSFTLPVSTAALAGWPLLLGGTFVAPYWLILAGLVWWPCGVGVPVLWPAVALVALLAWMQALLWCPYPLPFLRIFVVLPVLCALCVGALEGFWYETPASLMITASLLVLLAGYALAVAGLGRARRGDGPVWRLRLPWRRRTTAPVPSPPFFSPEGGLAWFSWRRVGWFMPLMSWYMPVMFLGILCVTDEPHNTVITIPMILLCPTLMAGGAGMGMGNWHPTSRSNSALTPFIAARPVPTTTLVADRVRLALLSTVVTWVGIYILLVLTALLTIAWQSLIEGLRQLPATHGLKVWLYIALALLLPPVMTWKSVVSNFWVSMTGRRWVGYVVGLAIALVVTIASVIAAFWLNSLVGLGPTILVIMPWILSAVVLLKLLLGAYLLRILLRRGLLPLQTLRRWAVIWLAAFVGLFALAFALTPAEVVSPMLVGCVAVLQLLPLVRLGLAPLALDWNRHR
jgi:hypothetical protein